MDYRLVFRSLVEIVITWGVTVVDTLYVAVMQHQSTKTVVLGKSGTAFIRGVIGLRPARESDRGDFIALEKLRKESSIKSYRQPTQVDWSSRPRGARERSLRNSAKQLGVLSKDALLSARRATANVVALTVYQKHRSVQTRKRPYTG